MAVASRRIDRSGSTSKVATSKTASIQAPTGGLNAIDSLAAMPPTDAVIMDNWFPQTSYCQLRNGYTQWSTGYASQVESIFPYSGASAQKIFAVAGTSVYDATSSGAVGAAVVTGLTNARWESTNISTSGGEFLYAANGVDKPLYYDGTAWVKVDGSSTPAITGVTTTTLHAPIVWKNRLWFLQDNTLSTWYLDTSAIGGAATQFDLTAVFRKGGFLQVQGTATLTNGSTFDDYIWFMTSEGQLALYGGTDPANASTFSIQGIFEFGTPVGRRCAFRLGDDTIIITSNGFVSLSKVISLNFLGQNQTISQKIVQLVNADIDAYGKNFGWEGVIYQSGNKVFINVPVAENASMTQYVMNTVNTSWCTYGRFASPWNFNTFCEIGDSLYAGGVSFVALCDTGSSDAGSVITGRLKPAFQYLGTDTQKYIKMARPVMQVTGNINLVLGCNVDFEDVPPTATPTLTPAPGSPWNSSPWNTSPWASGLNLQRNWQSVTGLGFSIALYLIASSDSQQVLFLSNDWIYEVGGPL